MCPMPATPVSIHQLPQGHNSAALSSPLLSPSHGYLSRCRRSSVGKPSTRQRQGLLQHPSWHPQRRRFSGHIHHALRSNGTHLLNSQDQFLRISDRRPKAEGHPFSCIPFWCVPFASAPKSAPIPLSTSPLPRSPLLSPFPWMQTRRAWVRPLFRRFVLHSLAWVCFSFSFLIRGQDL